MEHPLLAGSDLLRLAGIEVYKIGSVGSELNPLFGRCLRYQSSPLRVHLDPLHELYLQAIKSELPDSVDATLRGGWLAAEGSPCCPEEEPFHALIFYSFPFSYHGGLVGLASGRDCRDLRRPRL